MIFCNIFILDEFPEVVMVNYLQFIIIKKLLIK